MDIQGQIQEEDNPDVKQQGKQDSNQPKKRKCVCTVYKITRPGQTASRIPPEILHMDSRSIEVYKNALEEGKEKDYSVRLMVVGPYGVGKTALTKRLLQEDVNIKERESTDGIDIYVGRCRVSLKTKEWKIVPKSEVAEDFTPQRIAKVLQSPKEDSNRSSGQNIGEKIENRFADKLRTDDDSSKGKSELPETPADKGERGASDEMLNMEVDRPPSRRNTDAPVGQAEVEEDSIHLKEIKEVVAASGGPLPDDHASIYVWDFGGQCVFYTTHQMFLSHRAIYILVNNLSQNIKDIKMDDQPYFDCSEIKNLKIEDFLDIWLYSIHGQSEDSQGVPPIILVGTHADKLEPVNKKEKMDKVFDAIRNRFDENPDINSHFIEKDFGLSNAEERDPNLEDLRKAIIELAEQQSYWGAEQPAKWIPLEKALDDQRRNGIQIISREEFEKLNQNLTAPITFDEELEVFLKFQHEVGNIMYFGVPELKDKIVLSPQFLVNALKSLITAEVFSKKKKVNWSDLKKKGKLTRSLLDAVWIEEKYRQFQENREHILALMERLNIIAKPVPEDGKSPENSATQGDGFYFVPCMLREFPPEAILLKNPEVISTPCLCLELKRVAFPSAIFNRLLVGFISMWPVARSGPEHHIYCGCGQFVVDERKQHRLTMSFSCNVIALSVTRYSKRKRHPDVEICQSVYRNVQQILKKIGKFLAIKIEFDEYIQCPHGPTFTGRCLHSVQTLKQTDEFPCEMHSDLPMIQSSDLLKYWFDSIEISDVILTEKDFNRMAQKIGKEYEGLAIELGISQAEIDQIKMSYPERTKDQIRCLLIEWKKKKGNSATLGELERAMEVVKINVQDVLSVFST